MSTSHPRRLVVGYAAMTCTVLLWASFALSIRAIGSSSLTGFDAALLRFLVPVVVLAPWLGRTLRRLRDQRALVVVALGVGAGLPFFLVAAAGGRLTAAGMVGLVIPGTVPVFVALLTRSRLPRRQAFALGSILVGVALLAATWSANGGIVVLLLAGLMWSVYTVALRSSTLDPIGTALTLCLPSVAIAVPLMALGVVPSHLLDGTAAGSDIALFAVAQGVGVGVASTIFYTLAVRELGGPSAATFGAISPVLTALLAVPLFGEHVTPGSLVSLALMVGGVVAFNQRARGHRAGGARRRGDQRPARRGPVGQQAQVFADPRESSVV